MRDREILLPLEMELKKVATLGGTMAIVVVPKKYADKVVSGKRDMDTAVGYQDYEVVGMIGAGANEASASFLSVPKGIAVYPKDGVDLQTLFFLALERLRLMGSSHWVKRLWDTAKETNASERKQEPEARFISSTFYQFYAFIASHGGELGQIMSAMPASDQEWVKEYLPYGIVASIVPNQNYKEEDLNALMDSWGYQERMKEKLDKGTLTLRKFRNIEHLFTLPSISRQVIDLAKDSLASAPKMAKVIESDPVITSKLLKVVNSAFYGFHRQIDSVEHAIVILGNEEVVNLAFSIAIRKILHGISPRKARALWEHSLIVAYLSQWIGPHLDCKPGEMIYTLGLLHDLGKIVSLQIGEFTGVLDVPSSLDDLAGEEESAGLTHAEIGAYVAERWQLPESIVDGLFSHHLPSKALSRKTAMTVHIADRISHEGVVDITKMNYSAVPVLKESGIVPEKILKACEDIKAQVRFILDV
jgi:HD-like signal output (HDOD) protein